MKQPPFLSQGDFVGIVCTARSVPGNEVYDAIHFLTGCGWRVKLGYTVGGQFHQLGGTPEERKDDLNGFLADPEVRAIFIARGGFGHLDIVDDVDWQLLKHDPKWICGFSDVTVLHSHISRNLQLQSLHCLMPFRFSREYASSEAFDTLVDALNGRELSFQWKSGKGRAGKAKGVLTGGNLSVLHCLNGSISEPDYVQKILFIEEVDEYHYHIDRMLTTLRRAGKLDSLNGVVVGSFSDIKDHDIPFGMLVEEIIMKHLQNTNCPVAFGFPAGHEADNRALQLGAEVELNTDGHSSTLEFL